MAFKVTWKVHIWCILIAILFTAFFNRSIYIFFANYMVNGILIFSDKYAFWNLYIAIISLMIPVSLVHEVIHGIGYIGFGGKVRFGFKGVYAYTEEVTGLPLSKTQYLIILILPLIIISLASLLIPTWIGGLIFILNLLGSSGDIYIIGYLCRHRGNYYILGRHDGFEKRRRLN